MRNATSESWRMSLSVSCDMPLREPTSPSLWKVCPRRMRSGGDFAALEVLVRWAVVALGKGRALARLSLAGRRAAARDAAVERAGLDLLLDEGGRGGHSLVDGPRDLRLAGDREVAGDV